MKRIKDIKKIFIGSMSAILALTVLATSLPSSVIYALTPQNPVNTTQTGFADLNTYQTDKWAEIATKVFGKTLDEPNTVPTLYGVQHNTRAIVQDDNQYFNWKTGLDDSVTPWDGTSTEVIPVTETIHYDGDSVVGGDSAQTIYTQNNFDVEYTVYNVSTASELRYAIAEAESKYYQNTKINLLADINLNGSEQTWTPPAFNTMTAWLYVEGNGHTIYNMKCYNTNKTLSNANAGGQYGNGGFLGKFSNSNTKLIVKNLNFSNCMSLSLTSKATAVALGYISCRAYLENINIYDSFVFSNADQTGTLIGRTESGSGDIFLRNCSSQNCYVYGKDHSGGLTGCQHNTGKNYKVKYDAKFPSSPEAWLQRGTSDVSTAVYPEIIENSYSVDCVVFSVGSAGDSGAFISCGGKFICRNCFTNNIIYGTTNTGAFLGRIVTANGSGAAIYDDAGQPNIEAVFENCYASGSVEGTDMIGGFVGFENGISKSGVTLYKNCYTTAMVGMDYAGNRLGGFIGFENTMNDQTAVIKDENGEQINVKLDQNGNKTTATNPGSIYINCYAAGEVGNILTETGTTPQNKTTMLGGFQGLAGNNANPGANTYTTNGTYINCYYDMQTTAMRERACGWLDSYKSFGAEASQIPGVTGVYTQASELKGVAGLADTVDMGDATAWKKDNADDQYPMLLAFDDNAADNFGTPSCDDSVQDAIQAQLDKKVETVKSYSRASVSTVLLNHWDLKMNMNTGSIAGESGWEPGLEQNKLTKVKDGDEKWDNPNMDEADADGNHYHWEKTINSLAAGQYKFKIQQGNSWSHNFGESHYSADGDEITLLVPSECNVTIRFKYDGHAVTRGESSNYEIWADFTNDSGGQVAESVKLGWNKNARTINSWYVMGDMNGWGSSTAMTYLSGALYEQSFELKPGSYSFKIAGDGNNDGVGDWTENYGQGGKRDGANMSFTLTEKSEVTITFDEDTHITTVSANPSSAITDIKTESESIEFTGYSVIAPKEITGHDWLDGLEAAQAGELSRQSDGTYRSKNFTITADAIGTGKNFGYKVIEDAVDSGQNRTFHLTKLPEGTESINIYFTYDPIANETHVLPVDSSMKECVIDGVDNIEFYSILGSRGLTGLDFDWDNNGLNADEAQRDAPQLKGQTTDIGTTEYTYAWQELPAGEYSFKVVGNGLFSSGVDYGANDGSGNYNFEISETSTVTITFTPPSNENSAYIEVDAVNSEGESTLVRDRYVVSGNEQIAGVGNGWNPSSEANEMYYDDRTGIYTKTYDKVPDDRDLIYAFKVVEFGKDNTNHNISFSLQEFDENGDTIDYSGYKLVVLYYPNTRQTVYHLLDGKDNRRDEYMIKPKITTYYVLGDANLTGNEWSSADGRGRMSDDDGDGIYEVTFDNVKVSPTPNTISFKVVPNAGIEGQSDWYAGISYGDMLGGNYKIVLGSESATSCNVKISFDTNTETISVETTPDCLTSIDESQFEWFICGDADLVSSDAYMAEKTVYDTVRDITSPFEFTAFKNMTWLNDTSDNLSNRNSDNNYYSYLGGNEGDDTGFDIEYTVDGKNVSGNFNTPVIKITSTQVGDGAEQITKYSCENFMPGRRWVTVKVAADDAIVGNRNIRLIPTAYLEAGVDSQIQVLSSGSDSTNIYNVVTYNNQGEDLDFKLSDGKSLIDPSVSFNYYNYALTAGYAITDINGIGYYGTYNGQSIQKYSEHSNEEEKYVDDLTAKRPNSLKEKYDNSYFVMTSAYAETPSYSDETNAKFTDTDSQNIDTNLSSIDSLTSQSLIGSSYTSAGSGANAPTIVKVYKLDRQEDESKWDNCLEFDGVYYQPTKVFMDSDPRSANAEYHLNYLKWTGQRAFEINDAGYYAVVYYWSLADGRYLSDVKTVEIVSGLSTATKNADTEYVEKNSQFTDSTNAREIQYTVDYTNRVNGEFTVLDILPFYGDSRLASSSTASAYYHTTGDFSYTLKDVSITVDKTLDDGTVGDQNVGYTLYYTDDKSIRDKLPSQDQESSTIAQGLDLSGWTLYQAITSAGHKSESIYHINSKATAIALKGTQTGKGTSKISITFTLSVTNLDSDGNMPDRLWNNAFYSATDSMSKNTINGYTQPVSTVALGRKMSGFVWIDKDFDGKYDNGESTVKGVRVTLYKGGTEVKSVVTGNDGSYSFDDIYSSDDDYSGYYTKFSCPSNKVAIIDSDGKEQEKSFDELFISRTLSQFYVDGNVGSRNVAVQEKPEATENKSYLINNQQLPNSEEVYKGNFNRMYYGMVNNYYYSKPNQNLALAMQDYTTIKTSLKIHKVDADTDQPLEGVGFMLEYRESEDYSYSAIYCKFDEKTGEYKYALSTDEGAKQATNVTTNANGDIQFTELPVGQYRITEVKALDGYNLIPNSVEFNLPYTIEEGNIDGAVKGNDENPQDGVYYDITYTVKNAKLPSLPLTGVVNNNFMFIALALGLIAVSVVLTLIYRYKYGKRQLS